MQYLVRRMSIPSVLNSRTARENENEQNKLYRKVGGYKMVYLMQNLQLHDDVEMVV